MTQARNGAKEWRDATTVDLYATAESSIYSSANAEMFNKENSTIVISLLEQMNETEDFHCLVNRGNEVVWAELKEANETLVLHVTVSCKKHVGQKAAKAARKDISSTGLVGMVQSGVHRPKKHKKNTDASMSDKQHWVQAMSATNNNATEAMQQLDGTLELTYKLRKLRRFIANVSDERAAISPRQWFCGFCAYKASDAHARAKAVKAISHLGKYGSIKTHLETHAKG